MLERTRKNSVAASENVNLDLPNLDLDPEYRFYTLQQTVTFSAKSWRVFGRKFESLVSIDRCHDLDLVMVCVFCLPGKPRLR